MKTRSEPMDEVDLRLTPAQREARRADLRDEDLAPWQKAFKAIGVGQKLCSSRVCLRRHQAKAASRSARPADDVSDESWGNQLQSAPAATLPRTRFSTTATSLKTTC